MDRWVSLVLRARLVLRAFLVFLELREKLVILARRVPWGRPDSQENLA